MVVAEKNYFELRKRYQACFGADKNEVAVVATENSGLAAFVGEMEVVVVAAESVVGSCLNNVGFE